MKHYPDDPEVVVRGQGAVPVDPLPLWASPASLARATDPVTSHAAAARVAPRLTGQRKLVLTALQAVPEGLTYHEIDLVLGWTYPTTAHRRLPELERMGLVRALDATRDGQRIWRAA